MTFSDWIDFFLDKKFSLRFKICNFIMGDDLRNLLAVGCLVPLHNIENFQARTAQEAFLKNQAKQAERAIREIMCIL